MELIYLYIGDIGRQIKNQGFNFSNKYDVFYTGMGGNLTIKKKQNPIPKIYGDHIVNITALVGQNGVGKSTILNLLGLKDKDIRQEFGVFVRRDLSWFAIYEVQHNKENESIFLFEGYNRKYIPKNIAVENDGKYQNLNGNSEYYTFYVKRNFCNEQAETGLKTAEINENYCSHIRYFYYGQSARTTQGEENLKSSSKGLRDMERKYLSRCGSFQERINLCYALLNQAEDDGMKVLGEIFHTTSPEHLELIIKLPYAGIEGEPYKAIEEKSKRLYRVLYDDFQGNYLWGEYTEGNDCYRFCILLLRSLLFQCLDSLNYLDSAKDLQILQYIFAKFEKKAEADMTASENVEYLLRFIASFEELASSNDETTKKAEEFHYIQKISEKIIDYNFGEVIVLCVLLTGDYRYIHYIKDWLGKEFDSLIAPLEEKAKKANRKAFALDKEQIEVNEVWVKFRIKDMPEKTKEVVIAIAEQLDILYNSELGQDYHEIIKTSFSDMSTGELRFIDFFADLYEIFNKDLGTEAGRGKIENQTMILLFDEPDSCLHPEWARQFVYALNSILNVKPFAEKSINYQIILTTHSPIMLSDIPSEHIICMEGKEESGENEEKSRKIEVHKADFGFASNIYDIMKSSFFMEKYFGEFASRFVDDLTSKCSKLEEDILAGKTEDYNDRRRELVAGIELIGEPRLRQNYMRRIERMDESVCKKDEKERAYQYVTSKLSKEQLRQLAEDIRSNLGEDV